MGPRRVGVAAFVITMVLGTGSVLAHAASVDVVPPPPVCAAAVTDDPGTSRPVAVSRDGSTALFLETASLGSFALVRRGLATHTAVTLSSTVADPQDVTSAALSDDGTVLVFSLDDRSGFPTTSVQVLYDVTTGASTTMASRAGALVAVSGDGGTVAIAGGGQVSTYDVATATLTDIAALPADDARHVRISQDGRYLAYASESRGSTPATVSTIVYDRHAPVSLPVTTSTLPGVGRGLRMSADGLRLFSNDLQSGVASTILWQTSTVTPLGSYVVNDVDSTGRYVLATRRGPVSSVRIDRTTAAVEPMNGPNAQVATVLTADGTAAFAAGFLVRPGLPYAALTTSPPYRLARGTTSRVDFPHDDVVSARSVENGDTLTFDQPPLSDAGTLTLSAVGATPVHHVAITGPSGCVGLLEVPLERNAYEGFGDSRVLDTRPETAVGWQGPKPGPGDVVRVRSPIAPVSPTNPVSYDSLLVNVTVDDATAPGYVTVFDCVTLPNVSSVNATPGVIAANLAVVSLRDGSNEFCLFTQSGAHLIVDIEAAFTSVGTGSPTRLLDTRPETRTGYQGAKPGPGTTVEVTVPEGTTNAVLNVTGVDATAPGYVTVYPCGTSRPTASNLNLDPRRISANLVVVAAGVDHRVCLYTQSGTHLVVDEALAGDFEQADVVTPLRLLDTRPDTATGYRGGKPGAGQVIEVTIPRELVEAAVLRRGTAAVILNLTGVDASAAGFVTAFPCGSPLPPASNLNLAPGRISANLAVVAVGTDRKVCLFTQSGSDLVADLAGVV